MTALRFQGGGRHQTSPASLRRHGTQERGEKTTNFKHRKIKVTKSSVSVYEIF